VDVLIQGRDMLIDRWAKLPSFGGHSLETLPYLT